MVEAGLESSGPRLHRQDGVDTNAVAAPFDRQLPRHLDDATLSHAVHEVAPTEGADARDRTDVYDRPAATGVDHGPAGRTGAKEIARQVDSHRPLPYFEVEGVRSGVDRGEGAVEKHVHLATA